MWRHFEIGRKFLDGQQPFIYCKRIQISVFPTNNISHKGTESQSELNFVPPCEKIQFVAVLSLAATKRRPEDALFDCTTRSIHTEFCNDCDAAGLERVDSRGHILVPYSFRHTYGTTLARVGTPLTTTQKLMRHSSPEITAKYYIDVTPSDMLDALDKKARAQQVVAARHYGDVMPTEMSDALERKERAQQIIAARHSSDAVSTEMPGSPKIV